MYVLEQQIEQEQFPPEIEELYLRYIKEYLSPRYRITSYNVCYTKLLRLEGEAG